MDRKRCRRAHEPDFKAKAEAKFREISHRPGRNSESQGRWHKKSPNLSDFSGKSTKKIKIKIFNTDADESNIDTAEGL